MTVYGTNPLDYVEQERREAARKERERCAQLVREFGALSAREAVKRRVPKRGLIFKYVSAYDETVARLHDAAVFTCARLSECILAGYEPLRNPNEKIDLKTDGITGAAGREPDKSPVRSAVAEDASPRLARELGTADTYPCKHCTDPFDCGSWATCMANGRGWENDTR